MPLVLVKKRPKVIRDDDLVIDKLVANLPSFIASSLTCENPDGKLTADDIEVIVSDFGPFDVSKHDLMIVVWANSYPERLENLDARRTNLCKQLEGILPPKMKGCVWILLQDGSYGEF